MGLWAMLYQFQPQFRMTESTLVKTQAQNSSSKLKAKKQSQDKAHPGQLN
jgi:hypothetical protein